MEPMIGMIGCGNMGRAIVEGILKAKVAKENQIYAANRHLEKLSDLAERGIKTAGNLETAACSDILFLAVKPHLYQEVIEEIRDVVKPDVIVVAIAAGISIQTVKDLFQREIKVVRAMPNTPALVGEGMSGISFDTLLNEREKKMIIKLFQSFGEVQVVEERLMPAVGSASGSSVAVVFILMEAMADACVKLGMGREQAYVFVGQAVKGGAAMMLETKKHPGVLKDMVCSPNGTTIAGVKALEQAGFRYAVMDALDACAKRTEEMAQASSTVKKR